MLAKFQKSAYRLLMKISAGWERKINVYAMKISAGWGKKNQRVCYGNFC